MPSILTPEFVTDLRTLIKVTAANEYERLTQDLWWQLVTKERPSESAAERLVWLLDDARIREETPGSLTHDDIVALTREIENKFAGARLRLTRAELTDLVNGHPGGAGLDAAGHWARQMGALAAYWPQEKVAQAIRENVPTYDGLPLFATNHPLNPFRPAVGTYANLLTGASAGAYPGAVPIDESVTIDVARANVQKAIAYAATIKMPSGAAPRKLRPAAILVPPTLTARADLITGAETLPLGATGGAGSADVRPIKRRWGMADPVQADELSSGFSGGSDTAWYLVMKGVSSSDQGAIVYTNREPFTIRYHGPDTDAQLAVTDELEWTMPGRNATAGGHPYLLFKCMAS